MEENIKEIKKTTFNKTWLLVAGLVTLTAILLVVSLTTNNFKNLPNVPGTTTKDFAHTSLSISEEPRVSTQSGVYEADINIDTQKDNVVGVQLELSFDPKVLTNLDIKPGSFFSNPVILSKNINTQNGRITYAIAVGQGEKGVKGQGTIAVLSFSKINPAETTVGFLPQTQVNGGYTISSLRETSAGVFGDLSLLNSPSTTSSSPTQDSTR